MTVTTTQLDSYLVEPYLEDPYLQGKASGTLGTQVKVQPTFIAGMQANLQKSFATAMQTFIKIYNTTNLRFLCDFPSRGNSALKGTGNNSWGNPIGEGQNVKASHTATGDFSANNLNTDIVEQVWRSNAGTTFGVNVDFDTERTQGVFMDTFSIQNHNFTTSAVVQVLLSNDPNFSTAEKVITLQVTSDRNLYWISEDLPVTGQRYVRISINDSTNPDNYLQMGTVVFGDAVIFHNECVVDEIDYELQDFADTVNTEGFTNVAISRSQKKRLGLEFRNIEIGLGNFSNMRTLFTSAKTTEKCLYIPTPSVDNQEYMTRYAVFAKISKIPTERHNSKGPSNTYVSFSLELDESL